MLLLTDPRELNDAEAEAPEEIGDPDGIPYES